MFFCIDVRVIVFIFYDNNLQDEMNNLHSFSTMILHIISTLIISLATSVNCLNNGLARTPPMGWLSWAKFLCQTDCVRHPLSCISQQLYTDMADMLVKDGYKDVGYDFVNIDDCWSEMDRDTQGRLVANATRFPNGIPWLADYMHTRGLKLGIYGDIGTKTCGGYPGTLDHFEIDANTFASWNVDSLKLDGCYYSTELMPKGYPEMETYLNKSGRAIIYSCSWPAYVVGDGKTPNYTDIAKSCNLWRNYDDIGLSWQSVQGIINWYDHHQEEMIPVNGPGQWNDPDMIIVGNSQLTVDQSKAQFAIWSIWSAPLLMSNDLRLIPMAYKDILLNRDVIAVDQDPLGFMGRLTVNTTNIGIYVKPMTPYDENAEQYSYAIVVFNRHLTQKGDVTIQKISKLGLNNPTGYTVKDLYSGQDYGILLPTSSFSCAVNATGVVMIKATVVKTSPIDENEIDF